MKQNSNADLRKRIEDQLDMIDSLKREGQVALEKMAEPLLKDEAFLKFVDEKEKEDGKDSAYGNMSLEDIAWWWDQIEGWIFGLPQMQVALKEALKKHDSGRWRWDGIDAAWTGKDADLEPWGDQGCQLVSVSKTEATVRVRAYKSFTGTDVCLNLPKGATEEQSDACHEIWMERAQEAVCGCGSPGEWDGDSWGMTADEVINVPLVFKGRGKKRQLDTEKTASKIISLSEKALKDWEKEIKIADDIMNVLSGWRDNKGKSLRDGEPGPGSVWAMYQMTQKEEQEETV